MVDNTQYIFNKLVQGGVSPIGAMGLLGNWKAESSPSIDPTAQNPGGAYGIAQWNDRKPALFAYAKAQGTDPSNLDTQINFALRELHGPEKATLQALNSATDIRSATRAGVGYERPEGWSLKNPEGANDFSRRLNYASTAQGLLGSDNSGSSYNQSATAAVMPSVMPAPSVAAVMPSVMPAPNSSATTPATNPAGAAPVAGLLNSMASGGPAPQQSSMDQGLGQIAAAMKPAAAPDPMPQVQDPGLQRLGQQRQLAMQAAQRYLSPPPGFLGLLG